jgi:nucleoside-diphosphate-sugar epimerase
MKILITGANGYVGKSLYNALKDKYEVAILTRDKCDLTNSSDVDFYFLDTWFDIVIHCAIKGGSRLQQDDWDVMDSNLQMYYNLLNNKAHFGKFIHLGSGAELYAKDKPYGLSKDIIRKSISIKDNFYNLRIFGVFDENELDTRFIKANIKKYINKESIIIHQDKLMDFIYMPDLVKIIEYYINNDGPKELDCNYNNQYSLKNIANIINELDSYKVEVQTTNNNLGEIYTGNFYDLSLNFIGLEQGIKEVYNKLK